MARYRLSTDILSPINSDISLNNVSAFSFGSLSGTPCKDIISPICTDIRKESDFLCSKTLKESADAFEMITKDINEQSNINAEKEERFKQSYEMLKQSMDDLFFRKACNSSDASPVLKNLELENVDQTSKVDVEVDTNKISESFQNLNVHTKTASNDSENISDISSKRQGKNKKSSALISREKKTQHQPKNTCTVKGSTENKIRSKVLIKEKSDTKKNDAIVGRQKVKSSKVASISTQTNKSSEAKATTLRTSTKKNEEKEVENVKQFNFKCQQKIPLSNGMPATELKSLSLEKSIQITVGMEMDNIRQFVLDQNFCMHRDFLKVQEMVKKQNEVTGYMFSVIDELLESNKKLLMKCK